MIFWLYYKILYILLLLLYIVCIYSSIMMTLLSITNILLYTILVEEYYIRLYTLIISIRVLVLYSYCYHGLYTSTLLLYIFYIFFIYFLYIYIYIIIRLIIYKIREVIKKELRIRCFLIMTTYVPVLLVAIMNYEYISYYLLLYKYSPYIFPYCVCVC